MGTAIIKLEDGPNRWYLEWTTIADAPRTWGMTGAEFNTYYREEYGRRGYRMDLWDRMERVESKGTSSHSDSSVDDTIRFNRAGVDETELTKDEVIEMYCRRTGDIRGAIERDDTGRRIR